MTARVSTPAARRRGLSPAERIVIDVQRRGESDCWPWVGPTNRWGYGRVTYAGREWQMHRVAYALSNGGHFSDGAVVRHTCDNPPCCNPRHLVVGTPADNRTDCVSRDRHMRGERTPWAKLTDSKVREARTRHAAGETVADLAREHQVAEVTMRRAVQGSSWKHLNHGVEKVRAVEAARQLMAGAS